MPAREGLKRRPWSKYIKMNAQRPRVMLNVGYRGVVLTKAHVPKCRWQICRVCVRGRNGRASRGTDRGSPHCNSGLQLAAVGRGQGGQYYSYKYAVRRRTNYYFVRGEIPLPRLCLSRCGLAPSNLPPTYRKW